MLKVFIFWASASLIGACNAFDAPLQEHDAGNDAQVADSDIDVDAGSTLNDSGISIGSCNDAIRNTDESDVDCGGSCPPCDLGKQCNATTDCQSNVCQNGSCTCYYGPFSTPTNLGSGVNSSSDEWDPAPSADHLSLYFASWKSGGQGDADIYVASRASTNDAFSSPISLSAVNDSKANDSPSLWNGDLNLAYDSWIDFGVDGNLLYATRTSLQSSFTVATNDIFVNINRGDSAQLDPSLIDNGLLLMFSSNQPQGSGGFDIWQSTRTSDAVPFSAPTRVAELASSSDDGFSSLSRDGLVIFFTSDRAGGVGQNDIWTATRSTLSSAFGTPSLVANINSSGNEATPSLSADGLNLYFASNRAGGRGEPIFGARLESACRPLRTKVERSIAFRQSTRATI
ncbi:MAG: PD40 domain-containing protein [Myxococcales bacterium]|nr:MAG: PD40 domain-containing protein [Myxococcales bacterium]